MQFFMLVVNKTLLVARKSQIDFCTLGPDAGLELKTFLSPMECLLSEYLLTTAAAKTFWILLLTTQRVIWAPFGGLQFPAE